MTSKGALKIVFSFLLAGVPLFAACSADTTPPLTTETAELTEFEVEARDAADSLARRLKARLVSTMQAEGPLAAIEVCATEAPRIAIDVSVETGLSVQRTATRVRNASNAPDAWEREMLDYFSRSIRAGKDAAALEMSSVETENGQIHFRWARPILLEPQCTMCHGTNMSSELQTAIGARYPNDRATDFEPGELRGMFSVER
jgi:hypothetical protein